MIIVDYSGVAISSVFSSQNVQVNEGFIRHLILNTLRMYNVKYRDEYGKMILACDGGSNWRKKVYPQYKANRKKNREESGLDWEEFFRIIGLVRDEISQNLPYKVVHLQTIEADDVIATLVESTQEFGKNEPVMIISSDKDFIQLHRYKNVKQFSPMTKQIMKEADPVRALQEKVLRGDSGDGVPNVLNADNTFVDGIRQKPLTSKKIEEWIKQWDNLSNIMDSDTYKNFLRNRTMIDLSQIPEDKKTEIINTFESVKTNSNILNYLISKRCAQLIECAEEFN